MPQAAKRRMGRHAEKRITASRSSTAGFTSSDTMVCRAENHHGSQNCRYRPGERREERIAAAHEIAASAADLPSRFTERRIRTGSQAVRCSAEEHSEPVQPT